MNPLTKQPNYAQKKGRRREKNTVGIGKNCTFSFYQWEKDPMPSVPSRREKRVVTSLRCRSGKERKEGRKEGMLANVNNKGYYMY